MTPSTATLTRYFSSALPLFGSAEVLPNFRALARMGYACKVLGDSAGTLVGPENSRSLRQIVVMKPFDGRKLGHGRTRS
jgi:hypothetical protein